MRISRKILICGIIVILFCLIAYTFLTIVNHGLEAKKGIPSLAKMEQNANIKFPKGAKMLNGYFEGWLDYSYFAIIEFDSKYTDDYIKQISTKNSNHAEFEISRKDNFKDGNWSGVLNNSRLPKWWKPYRCNKFLTVKYIARHNVFILINLDNKYNTKVYIYTFTT